MLFHASIGNIQAYDPSKVHVRQSGWSDVWDGFAIIPRQFAEIYFSTRFSAATDYCWVYSRLRPVKSGECEYRLTKHLHRNHVPLGWMPKLWTFAQTKCATPG